MSDKIADILNTYLESDKQTDELEVKFATKRGQYLTRINFDNIN